MVCLVCEAGTDATGRLVACATEAGLTNWGTNAFVRGGEWLRLGGQVCC